MVCVNLRLGPRFTQKVLQAALALEHALKRVSGMLRWSVMRDDFSEFLRGVGMGGS